MTNLRARTSALALLAYAAVSALFNWPLPLRLSTGLMGPVTGDTGVYVWNLWLFRHEIVAHHRFPLFTQEILSLTPPVDLSLHNYTLFANLVAFPLIPILGIVTTFNVIYLALQVLTAWTMFLLARHVIGRTGEAWLTGLLFGFSPTLIARSEAHLSLVAAAPLPVFVLLLTRLDRRPDLPTAVAAGATMAWAALCDPYYGVFCLLIATCYFAARYIRVDGESNARAVLTFVKTADAVALLATAVIAFVLVTGGTEIRLAGVTIAVRSLYTPVLILTLAGTCRLLLTRRPMLVGKRLPGFGTAWRATLVAAVACATILSPILFSLWFRLADGGELRAPIFWRSSPAGVDLAAMLAPNPNHYLMGGPWRAWLTSRPEGYVDNVASLTFVGLVVVAMARWRYNFRPPPAWVALTVFFGWIALGPFVTVAGVNTSIPTPWALLRYVPLVGAARMPGRFAVVMVLGFSLLFGLALAHIGGCVPRNRRRLLIAVGILLGVELAPFPRQVYSARVPNIYAIIAKDPRSIRVLELPLGIRSGEWSVGDFNASSQFFQTFHEKRLIGGYLSRITHREILRQRQSRIVDALMRLSSGEALSESAHRDVEGRGLRFISRSRIGYVVIHARRTPAQLRQFAIDAFCLTKVAEDEGDELYVPLSGQQAALGTVRRR